MKNPRTVQLEKLVKPDTEGSDSEQSCKKSTSVLYSGCGPITVTSMAILPDFLGVSFTLVEVHKVHFSDIFWPIFGIWKMFSIQLKLKDLYIE